MQDVILYGAGSDVNKILALLDKTEYNPLCIVDGNKEKKGLKIQNLTVVSPEEMLEYDTRIIIITASFFDSIYSTITKVIGDRIDSYKILVSPYAWLMLVNVTYNELLLSDAAAFMKSHRDELFKLYDCTDKKTSEILNFIINARLEMKYVFYEYKYVKGMQYIEGYFFEGELDGIDEFTFVDAGAYIGDTYDLMAKMYARKMCKYYAYEPSPDNYRVLEKNFSSKEMCPYHCKNVALGERDEIIKMGKTGGEYGAIDGNESLECEEVRTVRLDDENINVKGKLVIKMDVEGAELSILRGGLNTIRKYKPIMAICVYHRYSDIYDLPKFLVDSGLKYRFILKAGIHTHMLAIPIGE